jgi:phage terminase large subunit GpA-like protein
LKLVGSLSASELSQMAIRDLYATELDRFAIETEDSEGDPVHLMKLRQRTFEHTSKLIMECSPTIAGESRIELEYQQGTQEHYFLPCPRCGFEQELLKPNFNWENATYQCVNCGEACSQRAWQSRIGSWRSCRRCSDDEAADRVHISDRRYAGDRGVGGDQRRSDIVATIRSFWVPAWLSELVSWQKIAEDYQRAKELLAVGDKSNMKTWIQTTLAEPWVEEQRPAIRGTELLSRGEEYDFEVPTGVLCLIACIDTQDEALKYLVSGVGLGKELWLIEFGSVLGNLEHEGAAVYAELEERVLRRDWHCQNSKVMRIRRGCQDAGGHHAGSVYEVRQTQSVTPLGVQSRRKPSWYANLEKRAFQRGPNSAPSGCDDTGQRFASQPAGDPACWARVHPHRHIGSRWMRRGPER